MSRNQIRFLDNPPVLCDTPEWRVARSVRSPRRLGGTDRAFIAISGPSTYSGLSHMNKFPRLSRAMPPVKDFGRQLRSSPIVRGFGCPSTALILSRQSLPTLDRENHASAAGLAQGAYVLSDAPAGEPQIILLASGSEVSLCVEAQEHLVACGIRTRVVSMPCWELFEQQCIEYRESVLPSAVTRRIAVEQASTFGWERYVGLAGRIIGMHTFGASAPLKDLQKKFGFRPDHVVATALELLSKP